MSARQSLVEFLSDFEHHPFPGYPDDPPQQAAYEELVETGGRLMALCQAQLAGQPVDAAEVPEFEVDLTEDPDDPLAAELISYRRALERLGALLRAAL